jgi:NAD-dependent DNA ligase
VPLETGQQLAKYARSEVDQALRTVTVLYEDDCEVVYVRDDLQKEYAESQFKRNADSFRVDGVLDKVNEEHPFIGEKNSIIHYHENAYVFQFPHENCHSILMSVEPTVGSQLKSFISACQDRL